jgi:hypothetical protein
MLELLVGPYKPYKVLQTGIIQKNDHEETKMDGIQVIIVRSLTTEGSRITLDKGYHLYPN